MRFHPSTFSISVLACTIVIGGCSQSSPSVTNSTTIHKESPHTEPPKPKGTESVEHLTSSFYTVDHYDKTSDPNSDLAETLEIAKTKGKRVLLQVGGDWCGWCTRISEYMNTNETVHQILDENFVVMKVTYPGDNAEVFLKQFPKCDAYPHFFVLQNDGKFLHSQGTAELEKEKSYDQETFVSFLEAWAPSASKETTLNKSSE